jgi:hypothetical protein
MAYYIFLKSLGRLEEFRKNPHIKIPPKSPPTNFQSLGIFKNPTFIQKKNFLQLSAQRPAGPSKSAQIPHPFFPKRKPRVPRVVVNIDKNIPLATHGANPRGTDSVHME